MNNLLGRELPQIVVVTNTTKTLDAEELRSGNYHYMCSNASGVTVTLPKGEVGMRCYIQRMSANAGHDVTIQANAEDTVLGSDAGKKVVNEEDAVSDFLVLSCKNGNDWVADFPLAKDITKWAVDNS